MNKDDAWAWSRTCHDREGRCITEFEVMEGPEKSKKLYKGKCNIKYRVQVMGPMGQPEIKEQMAPFEFDFPEGKGLTWCKNHFDEESQSAIREYEKAQKEAQEKAKEAKRKEVVEVKGGIVLGPGGRPIKLKG